MTIEVTAKKVDDAISQGLQQLGASLDEVNVEVVDAGGLFRKAKVRLTLERESAVPVKDKQKPSEAAKPEKSDVEKKIEKPQDAEKLSEQKTEKAKPAIKSQQSAGSSKNAQAPSVTDKQSAQEERTKDVVNRGGAKSDRKAQGRAQKPHSQDADQAAEQGGEKQRKQEASQDADASSEAQQGGEHPSNRKDYAKPRKLTAEDKAAAEHALEFVKQVTEKMGFTGLAVEADETGELIKITALAGDDSLLIGRHGETLSALSYLAETCARAEKCHINITVDCNGYRDRRAASLSAMAKRRANECAAKHRKIKLEPMERIDRRTIHNALTGDDRVSTASEGKEPYRCVVIIPNK